MEKQELGFIPLRAPDMTGLAIGSIVEEENDSEPSSFTGGGLVV
jgi:hypothetical protein